MTEVVVEKKKEVEVLVVQVEVCLVAGALTVVKVVVAVVEEVTEALKLTLLLRTAYK